MIIFVLLSSEVFRQDQITEFIDNGIYRYSVEKKVSSLFLFISAVNNLVYNYLQSLKHGFY